MIKFISGRVACFLCKDEDSKDNYDLYEYAVYIILSSAFHIATVIILGLCFNLLAESLVFYFSFIAIRKFAGGYHAKSSKKCFLLSIILTFVVMTLIKLLIEVNNSYLRFIFAMFELAGAIVIFILSPLDTDNNPLNRKEKHIYGIIAVVVTATLLVTSVLLIIFHCMNFWFSISFGIILSASVLIMRKVQIIKLAKV